MILYDPTFSELTLAIAMVGGVTPDVGEIDRLIDHIVAHDPGCRTVGNVVVTWDEPDEMGMNPIGIGTVS